MPHVIIEHSDNFDGEFVKDLILQIHQTLQKAEGNFSIDSCKGRAISYSNYLLADNKTNSDFFHITIKILSGRSREIRANLSKKVLDKISSNLSNYKKSKGLICKTELSVLIEEMDKEIYQKISIS